MTPVFRYTDYQAQCDNAGCPWAGDGPQMGNYSTRVLASRALREHLKVCRFAVDEGG